MNERKDLIRMAGKIFGHIGRFSRTVAYHGADGLPDMIRLWADEYLQRVHPIPFASGRNPSTAAQDTVSGVSGVAMDDAFIEPEWREYLEEVAMQEEAERQMAAEEGVVR